MDIGAGRWLGEAGTYVTGGYARGKVNSSFSTSPSDKSVTPGARDETVDGYPLGGDVETMVASSISFGLEYLDTRLDDDEGHVVRVGPGTAPATNLFLQVNPLGADMRRSNDNVGLRAFRVTAAIRFHATSCSAKAVVREGCRRVRSRPAYPQAVRAIVATG